MCQNPPPGIVPKISLAGANSPEFPHVSCTAVGVASSAPIDAAFAPSPDATLVVVNYHQRDVHSRIVAVTPLRITRGTQVLFQVP